MSDAVVSRRSAELSSLRHRGNESSRNRFGNVHIEQEVRVLLGILIRNHIVELVGKCNGWQSGRVLPVEVPQDTRVCLMHVSRNMMNYACMNWTVLDAHLLDSYFPCPGRRSLRVDVHLIEHPRALYPWSWNRRRGNHFDRKLPKFLTK